MCVCVCVVCDCVYICAHTMRECGMWWVVCRFRDTSSASQRSHREQSKRQTAKAESTFSSDVFIWIWEGVC